VVRRPPQHPSGEGEGLTCFRGGDGLVASRCATKEQGFGVTTSGFGASATLAWTAPASQWPRTVPLPQAAPPAGRAATWGSGGAATSGSSTNGTPSDSSSSLPPPSLIFGAVAVDLGENPQAAARYRDGWGRLLVGRLLGFEGASGWLGCGLGGHVASIPRASAAGRWPWGPARLASPPAPRPHGASRGRSQRGKG
jgi:hypothetical protein